MSARNSLLVAPPYPVDQALKTLGSNLRTARLRRNLSIEDVAAKTAMSSPMPRGASRQRASPFMSDCSGPSA